MQIDCSRCGEQFDTDREHPAGRHADTWRCPQCGASHDPDEQTSAQRGSQTEAAVADGGDVTIGADEESVEVHIHVHKTTNTHE